MASKHLQLTDGGQALTESGAQRVEAGHRITAGDDSVLLGMKLANAIWQAVHGGDGPLGRKPIEGQNQLAGGY